MFLPSCFGTHVLDELEMQAANISAVLLAIALWAVPSLAPAAPAAEGAERVVAVGERQETALAYVRAQADGDRAMAERALELLASSLAQARALLEAGYQRAPALIIALSALLLLPVAALFSLFVQRAARRRTERAAINAMARKAKSTPWTGEVPVSGSIPLWQQEAWLILDGSAGTLPLAGQVIRIGRHQDNDIRLPDASVHRYHAVIERTSEEEFVITDLSGKEGNGVRVNGERLERAHLINGDVIELGRTRLKFESVPI